MSRGSVRTWPPFYERSPRDKQPAILAAVGKKKWQIRTADGKAYPVASHPDVIDLAGEHRLDVYVANLNDSERGYPWLDDALSDDKTSPRVLPYRGFVGLECRAGVRRVWIGQALSWGYADATPEFLDTLIRTFAHIGQGTATTPGALGQAVMRAEHRDAGWLRVSRPPRDCRADLLAYGIGGRVDTPGLGQVYETAYEEDLRNAYAAAARLPLPVGTASRIPRNVDVLADEHAGLFKTWFCRCTVYVPETVKFSPVLYREGSMVYHADTAGWYGLPEQTPVWLWKHEADAARRAGMIVLTRGGWGWEQTEPMLASWAERMHAARESAPDDAVKTLIKSSIVAAIGRHGMHPVEFRLVDEAEASEAAIPLLLSGSGPHSSLYVEPTRDDDAPALTMWSSYIVSTVRLWLYQRLLEHEAEGNEVIATNYDAVILAKPSSLPMDPDALGGWRMQALSHVAIPKPRWLICDQKRRTPGQSGETAMEWAKALGEKKQLVSLSPTARYLRSQRKEKQALEFIEQLSPEFIEELRKGDP